MRKEERQKYWMKLFWLFLFASFGGAVIEIIFCFLTTGRWMSRSSVVYGQFSLVWGLGVVLLTISLVGLRNKNDRIIFTVGAFLGGVYEYLCSVVSEALFGSVFWDYSGFRFNIGGRVNLLFCLFWGLIALVWIRKIYPALSGTMDKIVGWTGRTTTVILAILMLGNMLLSTAALGRYVARKQGRVQLQATEMEVFMDTCFPDSRMERRFPNLKMRMSDGSLVYPAMLGK